MANPLDVGPCLSWNFRPSSVVPAPRARHALRMFQPFPAALLVAATTTRRRFAHAPRAAFSKWSSHESTLILGPGRSKDFWKLLRAGVDVFSTKSLGIETKQRLRAFPSDAFHAALRPEAVVSVTGTAAGSAVMAVTGTGRAMEVAVREELGPERGTTKFLLQLQDGLSVEAVLVPRVEAERERRERRDGRKASSTTICVSSQVGCSQGCRFCKTATMGILRNLHPDEILAQVVQGIRLAEEMGLPRPSNVVLMGMGEPLANFPAVMPVVEALTDPMRFAMSSKKVVLSTVAPSPAQVRMLHRLQRCQLAWSLHCVDDVLRRQLVPSARFSVVELREAFGEVLAAREKRGRRLMVAVVLLRGINDRVTDAEALASFLEPLTQLGVKLILDLIPYNDTGIEGFHRPSPEAVMAFKEAVWSKLPALCVYVRHPRGEDAAAACGQLATQKRPSRATTPVQKRGIATAARRPHAPQADALPESLCQEKLLEFDPDLYDLRGEATRLLAEAGPWLGFGCFVGAQRLEDFRAEEKVFNSFSYEKEWRRCLLGSHLLKCYDRFLQEVICPQLRSDLNETPVSFYCQHPPTLRLQPGPSRQPRQLHSDAKYGHQQGEINFWMPLTSQKATRTTLWLESSPGQGDFHALRLEPGHVARFHGTNVRHHVPPNKSQCSRVSLDFRIGVGRFYDPKWRLEGVQHYHPRRIIRM